MKNKIIKPNPYGDIQENDLNNFQLQSNVKLPVDYKSYLLLNNGGEFENLNYYDDQGGDYSLVEIFSLYRGPQHLRLELNYKVTNYYDLKLHSDLDKKYFVFALSNVGNLLLIKHSGSNFGSVYYLDHELIEDKNPLKSINFVSTSFLSYVNSLKSEKEYMSLVKKDPDLADFEERLIAAKKRSGLM